MAPLVMECPWEDCNYATPNIEVMAAIAVFNVHKLQHEAQPAVQVQAKPRAEKVPRPQIKLGVSQDEFSYFKDEWTSYKRSCDITDETETRDQLRAACNEDLRRNLFNCLGSKLKTLTEQQKRDQETCCISSK